MSKPDEGRNSPPRRGDNEEDGVVLFDPSPRPPAEQLGRTAPPKRRGSRNLLGVALAAVLAVGGYLLYQSRASSGSEPDLPPLVEPVGGPATGGRIELSALGGDILQGRVGSSMSLEVRARGMGSLAVVDSLVRFEVVSGEGLLDSDTTRTDSEGIARASLTLPTRPGTVVVRARLGAGEQQARLVVNVLAGSPERVVAREGNGQEAGVGELLPLRLAVVVYDEAGVPVPGAEVRFSPVSGGGIAAPSRARTDSQGEASVLWRLGFEAGTQQLSAAAVGATTPAMFSANAIGRPVASDGNPLPIEAGPVTVEPRAFVIGGSHVLRSRRWHGAVQGRKRP